MWDTSEPSKRNEIVNMWSAPSQSEWLYSHHHKQSYLPTSDGITDLATFKDMCYKHGQTRSVMSKSSDDHFSTKS